jgi:hypothetical protein
MSDSSVSPKQLNGSCSHLCTRQDQMIRHKVDVVVVVVVVVRSPNSHLATRNSQPLFLALVHLKQHHQMNLTKSVCQLAVNMNMATPDEFDVNNTVRDVVCCCTLLCLLPTWMGCLLRSLLMPLHPPTALQLRF